MRESFLGSMKSLNHAAELINNMSIQSHSAKAVNVQSKLFDQQLKFEREKSARSREVDDSIISMCEQQEKTNNFLEQVNNLTQDQIKLMAILVEAQNAIRQEQIKSSIEAKRAALIQSWMNVLILILTIIGVGYSIAEFHK